MNENPITVKRKIMVIVPYYWGKGDTITEAKKKCREAGATRFKNCQIYDVPPDAWVDNMGRILTKDTEDCTIRKID